MYQTSVAVVDASRARLFSYKRISGPEGLKEDFVEEQDFVNPARRLRPSELSSETRPGLSRTGNLQYAFDDHREAHIEALDAEFSRLVMEALTQQVRSSQARRLILCASPRILGQLRAAGLPRDVEVDELARDYVKLTASQLREHLESHGLLPARPARNSS